MLFICILSSNGWFYAQHNKKNRTSCEIWYIKQDRYITDLTCVCVEGRGEGSLMVTHIFNGITDNGMKSCCCCYYYYFGGQNSCKLKEKEAMEKECNTNNYESCVFVCVSEFW